MKGDKAVLEMLDALLTAELTAHNLYFAQHYMQEHWGYKKLADHAKEDAALELHHSEEVIKRTLYFDGTPNMNKIDPVSLGGTCEEQLKIQYDFECKHVANLKNYVKLCMDKNDFGTKELLDEILVESEGQCLWLETQFQRIRDVGIQNYLAEHMS
ncbi:MAG: bacterioferritin [Nitrospinae bacterium]|nr:bacterioferritin [Nitrospinota bacterium]